MQKTFIAIALALTLTTAFAYTSFNTAGYVKAPVSAAANNDSNYTNSSSLTIDSIAAYELDLIAYNVTLNTANLSSNTYNVAYRKLDGKALTASTNSSATVTGTLAFGGIYNGYAFSLGLENDTANVFNYVLYQAPVSGGAALGRVLITSNTNVNFTPVPLGGATIGKTAYFFYQAAAGKVNVSSFTAGGSKGSLEWTFSTANISSLNVVWGEALGSSQLFASWMEGGVLKDGVVDVSKGAVTANTVGSWQNTYSCTPFSTDKKWYGDLCSNASNGTTTFYVRSNTTSLIQLTTGNTNVSQVAQVLPYGPYIAVVYIDGVTVSGNSTYSYDIWNLDTFAAYRNKTTVVSTDAKITVFRVPSGGLYTLTYDANQKVGNLTTSAQNIMVGLVLGSSYLTTVFGFIMTVVAGLLLF